MYDLRNSTTVVAKYTAKMEAAQNMPSISMHADKQFMPDAMRIEISRLDINKVRVNKAMWCSYFSDASPKEQVNMHSRFWGQGILLL